MKYSKKKKIKKNKKKIRSKKGGSLLNHLFSNKQIPNLNIVINNIKFTLIYKTLPQSSFFGLTSEKRIFIVLESENLKTNEKSKIVFYTSLSELYTLRFMSIIMGKGHICKSIDYISSTFVHIELQRFIYNNFDRIPIKRTLLKSDLENTTLYNDYICTERELKLKSKSRTKSTKNSINNPCEINGRCIELCDYNYLFKDLSYIYNLFTCGDWHYLDENSYSQTLIIRLNELLINLNLTEDDFKIVNKDLEIIKLELKEIYNFEILYYYVYTLYVINIFLDKSFNKIFVKSMYNYNHKLPDGNQINCIVDEYLLISKINEKVKFLYYKLRYTFLDVTYFRSIEYNIYNNKPEKLRQFIDKEYSMPLFIIPNNTKINNKGIYECFLYNFNIFCKVFHYKDQFVNLDNKKYYISPERFGLNKNYFFIGDIIDKYLVF